MEFKSLDNKETIIIGDYIRKDYIPKRYPFWESKLFKRLITIFSLVLLSVVLFFTFHALSKI
jgi:hypothetical protein